MVNYNRYSPIFSQHVPRTGGTSFGVILQQWFGENYISTYPNERESLSDQFSVRRSSKPDVCINGHFENMKGKSLFELYPNAKQFITFLRDPLDQHISLYFHQQKLIKQKEFFYNGNQIGEALYLGQDKEWHKASNLEEYVTEGKSVISRFLPFKFRIEGIEDVFNHHFIHVGVLERKEQSSKIFSEIFEKPYIKFPHKNNSHSHCNISQKAKSRFQQNNPIEFEIHAVAMQMNS